MADKADDNSARRPDQRLISLLRTSGRATPQRLTVLTRLAHSPRHLTAMELHRDATSDGELIELSTVHRALTALIERQIIHCVYTPDGAAYGFNQSPHGHATCRECGATIDLAVEPDDQLVRVAAQHGYADPLATVTVSALCPACG